MWINYGDVGFMPILMSDDDVFVVLFYCRVTYIALAMMGFYAKRRWAFMPSDEAFMPSDEAFMPSVPIYGQSDGYHMYNIVVSHGVGYVFVCVIWCWVF